MIAFGTRLSYFSPCKAERGVAWALVMEAVGLEALEMEAVGLEAWEVL